MPAPTPITAGLKTRLVFYTLWNLLFLSAAIFLPAGTLNFWQGWAFIVISAALPVAVSFYFYERDPEVLARRLQRREPIGFQKAIILFAKVLHAVALVLAGFDFRFGWTRAHIGPMPWWLSVAALAVVAAADVWFIAVMRANSFASSIIQVEDGQSVAATGLYCLVRHPMYLGWIVRWLATPLALGSLVTVPIFCLIIPILSLRLLNEEKFLKRELPGYSEYCRQIRWRLVPYVW